MPDRFMEQVLGLEERVWKNLLSLSYLLQLVTER